MKKFTVGIIGNGFVGESQAFAFSPTSEIKIFDKNPLKSINTLNEVLESDFIFVCVPTPMRNDGSQDFSFIENVFDAEEVKIMNNELPKMYSLDREEVQKEKDGKEIMETLSRQRQLSRV